MGNGGAFSEATAEASEKISSGRIVRNDRSSGWNFILGRADKMIGNRSLIMTVDMFLSITQCPAKFFIQVMIDGFVKNPDLPSLVPRRICLIQASGSSKISFSGFRPSPE
ncbi:MAG: hypothetical protein ACOCPQ_03965 [Desulfosudaceae bacterium]